MSLRHRENSCKVVYGTVKMAPHDFLTPRKLLPRCLRHSESLLPGRSAQHWKFIGVTVHPSFVCLEAKRVSSLGLLGFRIKLLEHHVCCYLRGPLEKNLCLEGKLMVHHL